MGGRTNPPFVKQRLRKKAAPPPTMLGVGCSTVLVRLPFFQLSQKRLYHPHGISILLVLPSPSQYRTHFFHQPHHSKTSHLPVCSPVCVWGHHSEAVCLCVWDHDSEASRSAFEPLAWSVHSQPQSEIDNTPGRGNLDDKHLLPPPQPSLFGWCCPSFSIHGSICLYVSGTPQSPYTESPPLCKDRVRTVQKTNGFINAAATKVFGVLGRGRHEQRGGDLNSSWERQG